MTYQTKKNLQTALIIGGFLVLIITIIWLWTALQIEQIK